MQEVGVPDPDDSLLCDHLKYLESLVHLHKLLSHLPESKCAELPGVIWERPCLVMSLCTLIGQSMTSMGDTQLTQYQTKHLNSEVDD